MFRISKLLGIRKKWLIAMKTFVLLFFAFSLQLNASVFSQRVNLRLKNVSAKDLIREIESQTNLGFIYNLNEIEKLDGISIDAKEETVKEVLDEVLKDTDLTYEIDQEVIIIKPRPVVVEKNMDQQQQKSINGKVTDKNGEPLPGVSVLIKGSYTGTTTNMDGFFNITVDEGTTLVFSFVGMTTQEVLVENQKTLQIVMEEDAKQLEDVVVNGYFVRKKESFTGSATVVKQDELKKMGVDNLVQSLGLLDPSFQILEGNEFGSDINRMPDIRLRGSALLQAPGLGSVSRSSLTGNPNQPIFIMDNFETTLEKVLDLDMNRVESVTILKDAAATAIYGSRAANGVIVVKTIQPKSGQIKVSYNLNMDFSFPDLDTYDLLNAEELFQLQKDLNVRSYRLPTYKAQASAIEKNLAKGTDTDWLAQPVRNAVGHRHSLNLMGGDDKMRYMFDLSYADRAGVMKGSDRENLGMAVTLHYNSGDNLAFSNRLSIDKNNSSESPYGSFDTYTKMQPYFPIYDDQGNLHQYYTYYSSIYERDRVFDRPWISNPMYEASVGNKDESKYTDISNNFQMDWTILPSLRWRNNFTYNYKSTKREQFVSPKSIEYTLADVNPNVISIPTELRGAYRSVTTEYENFNINSVLTFTKDFNGHFVNASLGFNASQTDTRTDGYAAQGFSTAKYPDPSFAAMYELLGVPIAEEGKSRLMGLLTGINYSYNNRYLFDFTYRLDGSSQFGANKKTAGFYSVGLGWNLHNENFLRNNKIINQLKIRSTYGETGSINFAPYQAKNIVNYFKYTRYLNLQGTALKGIGNEDLKWQTTETLELGLDFGLFNNTLSGSVNFYDKHTVDMVSPVDTPTSMGFRNFTANLGELSNKGIEFSLKLNLMRKNDINWNVYANGAHNKSEILSIGNSLSAYNEFSDLGGYSADDVEQGYVRNEDGSTTTIDLEALSHQFRVRFEEGGSPSAIWAVKSLGIDPLTGQEIFLKKDGTPTFVWNTNDKVVVGDEEPTLKGTFGTSFAYKNIDINLTCRYQYGGQVYNATLADKIENSDKNYNVDRRVLEETWREPGDMVRYVSNVDESGFNSRTTGLSSRFVQDFDLLELSSINVNYNLPKNICQKFKMESMRLSFNMNDIFYTSTVKRERGTAYPFARSFTLGLRANF